MLNNNKITAKNLKIQHTTKRYGEEFTSPGLHLLGLASNGLGLSIMLKSVKTCVYNAEMLLKPAPISPEYSKMAI